jgi:hypothetical protein
MPTVMWVIPLKISNIPNEALQERLLWKFNQLPKEMQGYASLRLSEKIENRDLQDNLLGRVSSQDKEIQEQVLKNVEAKRNNATENIKNVVD